LKHHSKYVVSFGALELSLATCLINEMDVLLVLY
jgi:hypothetical protein